MREVVGARGFEPPTLRSRTVRATKLRYAPSKNLNVSLIFYKIKAFQNGKIAFHRPVLSALPEPLLRGFSKSPRGDVVGLVALQGCDRNITIRNRLPVRNKPVI